jgi:hypothetical protein
LNSAPFLRIIKNTEPVSSADDIQPPVFFLAVLPDKGVRGQSEETGDSLDFAALNRDPTLSITARAALFAFKSFHLPQTHTDRLRLSYLSPCGTDMNIIALKEVTQQTVLFAPRDR